MIGLSQDLGAEQRLEQELVRLEIEIQDLLTQDHDPRSGTYGGWEVALEGSWLHDPSPITAHEIEALRQGKNAQHYIIPTDRLCVAEYDAGIMQIILTVGWPRTRGETDEYGSTDAAGLPLPARRLTSLSQLEAE